jgi:hypothetical protein
MSLSSWFSGAPVNGGGDEPAAVCARRQKNTPGHGARHLEWVKTGREHPVALKAETGNEAEFGWLADTRCFWIMTLPCFFRVFYFCCTLVCLSGTKHKNFLIEIRPHRRSLIRAWTSMRSTPKAGQEDIPVCYEKWNEGEQVNKALEKAKKEADQIIEQARSAPRPEPEQERRETEPEAA